MLNYKADGANVVLHVKGDSLETVDTHEREVTIHQGQEILIYSTVSDAQLWVEGDETHVIKSSEKTIAYKAEEIGTYWLTVESPKKAVPFFTRLLSSFNQEDE